MELKVLVEVFERVLDNNKLIKWLIPYIIVPSTEVLGYMYVTDRFICSHGKMYQDFQPVYFT